MASETATTTTTTTTTTTRSNAAGALQEVQETVSRIASHKGVKAVLILNGDGDIITQSGGENNIFGNTKLLKEMLDIGKKYVKSLPSNADMITDDDDDDDNNEELVTFVRIRCNIDEILVAPKNNYVLVVLQDPSQSPL